MGKPGLRRGFIAVHKAQRLPVAACSELLVQQGFEVVLAAQDFSPEIAGFF